MAAIMQSYQHDTAPIPNKGPGPTSASWSAPSQPFPYKLRRPVSYSAFTNQHPVLTTSRSLGALRVPDSRRSITWSSSSGDPGLLSDIDELDDREEFVEEYNRLAKKYGIRPLVPGDFPPDAKSAPIRRGSWFTKALRRTSSCQSTQAVAAKPGQQPLRHRRSISDVALNLVHHPKKTELKGENLQDLVRLCGKSLFYLPAEYTPCSLVLPTCFRALAQSLVQQADTRGIFRIPGSVRVVNNLYDYYCADRDSDNVSTTTRCPNLPAHIKYNVHDVASAFKKFLSGLPGGILGSLSLFDALVAIHSQLHADPELNKTKETKLRARLIALAIGTVKSQYQRELICAVFGLLCFIGREAENAPREDEDGRPLPTTELMGYKALGVVFGPLLVNNLIDSYNIRVADPSTGLVLLPVSAPRSRKERRKRKHKKSKSSVDDSTQIHEADKVEIANSITEMLITHWREVVRQMRSLGTLRVRRIQSNVQQGTRKTKFVSSASDAPPLRKPLHQQCNRSVSPINASPDLTPRTSLLNPRIAAQSRRGSLSAKRRLSRQSNSASYGFHAEVPGLGIESVGENNPSDIKCIPSVDQACCPMTSHIGQIPPRDTIGSTPRELVADNYLTGGKNEGENRDFNPNPHLEHHGGLPQEKTENLSTLRRRSPSDHALSGSERTFHSVKSSIPGIRSAEGNLVRQDNDIQPTEEPEPLDKWSPQEPVTPIRSPLSIKGHSNSLTGDRLANRVYETSPVDEWKALRMASKASTESLARSTKERRMRRSPRNGSFRRSEESLIRRNKEPRTPESKRQPMDKTYEKPKPSRLSPEKMNVFEIFPESSRSKSMDSPQKLKTQSPIKRASEGEARPFPRRSNSRPTGGAVKAMAALFENAISDSPGSSFTVAPETTTGRGFEESSGIPPPYLERNPSLKHLESGAASVVSTPLKDFDDTGSVLQTVETQTRRKENASPVSNFLDRGFFSGTPENTPGRVSQVSRHPTGSSHYAARKQGRISPAKRTPSRDGELDQPLSLGTMVPYLEEPPVAQHLNFTRPTMSTPPVGYCESDDERIPSGNLQRPGSGNSMLHARVRHLYKQLEIRSEETTQLRRQLEARKNMDIGKLCEQLRVAKRECRMWRERAEAAKKRVAVFKRFTARVRGIRDTMPSDEMDQGLTGGTRHEGAGHKTFDGSVSSTYSEHTVNNEQLKDRIFRGMRQRAARSDEMGTSSEKSSSIPWGRSSGILTKGGIWRKKATDNRTAQLWGIAEELLKLDENEVAREEE
ncbi:hypothetical protein M426DRAFT_266902 [Hypoxylon sp. CI-4A]|nr:hypothetical protein M426DRAFT_266902 [Hypoxylon sp. CI-4A]